MKEFDREKRRSTFSTGSIVVVLSLQQFGYEPMVRLQHCSCAEFQPSGTLRSKMSRVKEGEYAPKECSVVRQQGYCCSPVAFSEPRE